MRQPTRPRLTHEALETARARISKIILVAAVAGISSGTPTIGSSALPNNAADDQFIWLEGRESPAALSWVRSQNSLTAKVLEDGPLFKSMLALSLDNPSVEHPSEPIGSEPVLYINNGIVDVIESDTPSSRGTWKRTNASSYFAGNPTWRSLLNVDRLGEQEHKRWVIKADGTSLRQFDGFDCLPPERTRCLVSLSDGGRDAIEIREFDAEAGRFVQDGYFSAEAKQYARWLDQNTVLIASDFGPGTLTDAGMPRQVRVWPRGTSRDAGTVLVEADQRDIRAEPRVFRSPEGTTAVVQRRLGRADDEWWIVDHGTAVKLPLPTSARIYDVFKGHLIIGLRGEWQQGQRTIPAGSIVAVPIDGQTAAINRTSVVVAARPGSSYVIASPNVFRTRDALYIAGLNHVNGELLEATYRKGWSLRTVPLPKHGTLTIRAADAFGDSALVEYHSFLEPGRYYRVTAREQPKLLGHLAPLDRQSEYVTDQGFARSRDGTLIPYFLVRRRDLRLNGSNPTILEGYGGFGLPQTPWSFGPVDVAWVRDGGLYVLANIRGGGEYGPDWHKAAIKENRQRSFDDFAAVAEDLIRRRITTPRRLGIIGGSNGGLLAGVMLTQHPELFSAVVAEAPLLDMVRYTQLPPGASYISEYGDPHVPEELAYIRKYSPYQNLHPGRRYPATLLITVTNDERAHPAHARKMAAKMQSMGLNALFLELGEGGHSAGIDEASENREHAVVATFFRQHLMSGKLPSPPAPANRRL